MPRRNRIDPWGDLHANPARGMFTGNRGCVVDEQGNVVKHHGSSLWIICELVFRDWKSPLARGRRWTPLFFLDEAVALAAGHRPCAFCRRNEYNSYRDAISAGLGRDRVLLAPEINSRLIAERHIRGRGLVRVLACVLARVLARLLCGGVGDGAAQDEQGEERGADSERVRPHGVLHRAGAGSGGGAGLKSGCTYPLSV